MIARTFRPVGWVAAVGAAALGCYMLSLQVAAERAELDRLDARIIATSQEIRSLQTELGTRGRMQQLEEWNDQVLALSAPVSGQFVEGNVSLARFDIRQPQIAPDAEVRLASAETRVPAPPPLVRRASATVPPAPAPAAAPKGTVPERRLSPVRAPVRTAAASTPPPVRTAAAAEPTRPTQGAPRRSAGLLDERTIRDLGSASRAERGGGTAD